MRWVVCILPPAAVLIFEETPNLSNLDGINAAALIVLSPVFIAIGFGFTALLFVCIRWLFRKLKARSRFSFALMSLTAVSIVGLPLVEGDWPLLGAIVFAAIPAAILLTPKVDAIIDKSPATLRWGPQP